MIDRALLTARLALALGRVDRATYHEDGRRKETDTDHTVMLCLLVADLAQLPTLRERVDLGRLLAFALVHDVVEAYAGDTVSIALTPEQRREKAAREAEALTRLRSEFGHDSWIVETIETYERQDTLEARLVNFVDKVAPKLTHALNGGTTLRGLGLSADRASAQHVEQLARLAQRSPDLPEIAALFEEAHGAAIRAYRAEPPGTLPALLAEKFRIRDQADAEIVRLNQNITAALREMLPAPWEVHCGWAKRHRRPGRGQLHHVDLSLIGDSWHAHATYRPSDNSPAGGPDRVTGGAIGATPRDALAQLAADVERLIPRMRRPEVIADLRHLRQWLLDVVAGMDGVEVVDG